MGESSRETKSTQEAAADGERGAPGTGTDAELAERAEGAAAADTAVAVPTESPTGEGTGSAREADSAGANEVAHETVSIYRRATWELELLISAALVFSLFQLPGRLTAIWNSVEPTLSAEVFILPFLLFYASMLAVYALTAAFTAHFVLRSFWVGVCGLRSTFPRGIDWSRFDGSDWAKRQAQHLVIPLKRLERLVDRVASGIFGVLFAILLLLLTIFGYTLVGMLFAMALWQWVFEDLNLVVVFYALLVIVVFPALYLGLVERALKKDPSLEQRWPRRVAVAERLYRWSASTGAARLYQPIVLAFATNFSSRATSVASGITVFALVSFFLVSLILGSGEFGFDSYKYSPSRSGERSVRADHYDDELEASVRQRLPLIQSRVIEGPFVELFMPYHPRRDTRNIERVCPQLRELRSDGLFRRHVGSGEDQRHSEVLRCLQRLYEVEVDGTDTTEDWVFYRHPVRGLEGVLLHIDVRGLHPGRHELVVRRVGYDEEGKAVVAEKRDGETTEEFELRRAERRYVIPFWV